MYVNPVCAYRFFLVAFALLWAVQLRAEGEERSLEDSTQWVDPVEYFELQDITTSDLQRDYDQGDIDFNKVLKAKGKKVYGLRLKPIAGAFIVDKFMSKMQPPGSTLDVPHQNLYGVKGHPIHEASFCVYMDESVSRSYSTTNTYKLTYKSGATEDISSTIQFDITNLRLVPTASGLGFSYAFKAKESGTITMTSKRGRVRKQSTSGTMKKDEGVDEKLGHFIYYQGARELLVILSAPHRAHSRASGEEKAMASRPWNRVYFIVEEILVESEGGAFLSEEDRQAFVEYLNDLTTWLSGEGDPLGLGEHTDAKTSAVINTIGMVAAILLGNGLAGILGGGAGGFTSALTGGIASSMPPPPAPGSAPSSPDMPDVRRPEEEEGEQPQAGPPSPPEPGHEFFDKYARTDADGDICVKDPVTGNETLYVNNGDGTYRNLTTGQDWTPAELNERLRYRDENSGVLKQDADQAARNAAEQHAQWEQESQTLSQDGQDYLKWKHEQEAAERKREQVVKLAEKYGVSPDERIVRNTIRHEQELNQIDSELNKEESDILESKEKYLETVDKTCEIGVNVMSNFVPGGNHVKDVYTFAKSTLVATSEAIADGKSAGAAVGHVMVGITDGALGVIQNRAGDLAGKGPNALGKEYGITILTENLKEGMKELYKTGDFSKAGTAMINATGKKTADFGFGKALGYGMGKLKDAAGQGKLGEGTSKMIDKWFNQKHSFHAGQRAEVYKIGHESVKTGDFKWGVSKGAGFSKFYSGTVDFGKVTEGVINEGMNQTGMHDWAGRMATGVTGKVSEIAGEVAYDVSDSAHDVARIAGEFAQKVTQFSDMAANYKKEL